MSKQTEYSNAFIRKCELLFQDIRENKSLKICIETLREAQQAMMPNSPHLFEPLWFIYYMYFAIHNPKLEEYINMKDTATADEAAAANILKNMIRRRANTSTLVFQLYMYANIQKGAVTYIYPASTATPTATPIIKSLTSTHLKTAAAVIHKQQAAGIESIYNDYVAATAHPRHNTSSEAPAVGGRYPSAPVTVTVTVPSTRLSTIKYSRKDIIFLALVCYMKIDEIDINTKGLFISATKEEIMASPPSPTQYPSPSPSPSPYDEKYKYLLT